MRRRLPGKEFSALPVALGGALPCLKAGVGFADNSIMKKNFIRVLALVAVSAWPAVEGYRLWEAHQQLAAAAQLEQKVSQRLADARGKSDSQVSTAANEAR